MNDHSLLAQASKLRAAEERANAAVQAAVQAATDAAAARVALSSPMEAMATAIADTKEGARN